MAAIASPMKVAATRDYGAAVVLHGQDTIAAFVEMERRRQGQGLTFGHPFDDPYTIVGQRIIGVEPHGAAAMHAAAQVGRDI